MSSSLPSTAVTDRMSLSSRAPHVLIIDADKNNVQQLDQYLRRQGFNLSHALTAQDARDFLAERSTDIILVDQNLPDSNSIALCQEIKQSPDIGYTPVIIMLDDPEERESMVTQLIGIDDFLIKPFHGRDLLLRIIALLRTKQHIDRLTLQNHELSEDLLAQTQAIEELQQRSNQVELLKQHIIDTVNHELRTPMLQIKSAVSMLVDVINELSEDDKVITISRYATQAVGRMEELIYNISQLHLIEHIKLMPISLNDAISQAIHTVRRSWSQQDNIDRIEYHKLDASPYIVADRRALPRLLFLLVDNALKFSDKDQIVEIITANRDDEYIDISIKDYGIGIPKEYHERIFEAFFQVEQGTTKRFYGVGVGLASAQMLARSMETEICVDSSPGNGSQFTFSLRIAKLK